MSKKGVAKITGPTNPQIGASASYSVTEWYKETPASQRNGNNVTWELFRKRNNGSYTSTNIKKKGATGTFTFEEKALGQEFFVEGYLNSPEKKGNTIIYIRPTKGAPKIISLTLLDSNKKKITIKPKYGQTIVAEIKTQNMFKEKLILQVWERDTTADTGHNKDENILLYEKEIAVNANGVNDENIVLTELMMKKAQGSRISFMIDGGEHEYYLVVKHNNISTFSPQTVQVLNQIIAVKGNGINPPPENPETASNVGQDPNQQGSEGKCPRCEKDFTWDEIKEIFGESDKTFRMDCVNWINKYKLDFGINTCAKKAHFLAQIAAETHFREKEMAEGNVKYIPRNIRSGTFGDRGKLLDKRGQIEEFCNERPDQKKLFSFLYAAENGFGNGNGNEASGDGFNFRGKGLIQLTGKGNYKSAMGLIKEYVPAKIYSELISSEKRIKHFDKFEFEENRKQKTIKDVDLFDFITYYDMPTEPKYAVLSALADWKGKGLSNSTLMVNDVKNVRPVRKKINVGLKNLDVATDFFKKSVSHLKVNECTLGKNKSTSTEKGTVILVSGTDKRSEKDPAQNIYWIMYQTTVYKDITLATFKKLKGENKLPNPDYTTYLSRDTHQTYSKSSNETFKHSDKRFGKYNEIPPGEYFLVPGLDSQKYLVYVIDSESKSAGDENGINGPDGARGGVALHHYCPRFSVGCFTFNSGKDTTPVKNFVKEIPDLSLGDNRPVHFIVEPRQVKESQWDNPAYGTTKWTGI